MEILFEQLKYVCEGDIVTSYFKDEETQRGYTTCPRVVPGTKWVLKKSCIYVKGLTEYVESEPEAKQDAS